MPSTSLKTVLTNGLRRSYRAGRNEPGLVALKNMIVSETALYPYEDVITHTDIVGGAGDVPAVVMFRGPTYIVAFGSNGKIYTLADGNTAWVDTEITTSLLDPDDPSETKTFSVGTNHWHFAAFYKGWIACNGVIAVFSIDGEGVYCDNITYPLSVCSFKGRVFYGGVARHWLRWISQGYSTDLFGVDLDAFSDSWVGWCSPSGEDILQHVWPEQAVSSSAGRVGDEVLANGDFSSGSTGWLTDTGWTFSAGPPARMIGATTSTTLEYSIDSSSFTKKYYRIEVDIEVSGGSVEVTIDNGIVAETEYIGENTLDADGNYVFYFSTDSPTDIEKLKIDATGFDGDIFSVSMKESEHFSKFTSFIEQQKQLESGFSPAVDQGDVLCVKPLRDYVVVYGEHFITAYGPSDIPAPVFGKIELAEFGIAGRGAVGGSLEKHLLADVRGKLWMLDNRLSLQEVGYEEWLEDSVSAGGLSELTISYDGNEDNFYIAFIDAERPSGGMFLYSGQGLSEIGAQLVHCLVGTRYTSAAADISGCITDGSDDSFHLLTDLLDFEAPGLKTLHSVQVLGEGYSEMLARIWYLDKQSGNIHKSSYRALDNRGEFFPEQTGLAYQIELLAVDYSAVRIYDLIVDFSVGGKINSKSLVTRR